MNNTTTRRLLRPLTATKIDEKKLVSTGEQKGLINTLKPL